jgi:hypothetical protein
MVEQELVAKVNADMVEAGAIDCHEYGVTGLQLLVVA